MYEPNLAPGECVIQDYGNQFIVGPCTGEPVAAALGGGVVFSLIAAAILLYTEADRRRQMFRAFIHSVEGEI